MIRNFYILLLFLIGNNVCSQSPYFSKISGLQGLKSSTVYSVEQDSLGFIWMTTDRGAQRFDGFNLQSLKWQNGTIVNEEILNLKILNENYLFLTFSGDLIRSNGLNDAAKIELSDKDIGFLSDVVYLESEKRYLVTTSNRFLFQLNDEFQIIKETRFNTHIRKFVKYNKELLALAQDGIYVLDNDNLELIESVKVGNNTKRYAVSGNRIFISEGESVVVFDLDKKSIIKDKYFNSLGVIIGLKVIENEVYALTRNGMKMLNFKTLLVEQKWLPSLSITDIEKDEDGGIWLSTLYNGVFYAKNPNGMFYPIDDTGIYKKATALHVSSDSLLWVGGSSNNYKVINLNTNEITDYTYSSYNKDRVTEIIGVNNDIWILSKNALIIHKNGGYNRKILPYRGNCLKFDGKYVWLGGISLLKLKPQEVENATALSISKELTVEYNNKYVEKYETNSIYDIEDLNGEIYIGTLNGLYKLKDEKLSEISYFKGNRINTLLSLEEELFIGSKSQGFYSYSKNEYPKHYEKFDSEYIQDINSFSKYGDDIIVYCNDKIFKKNFETGNLSRMEVLSPLNYKINKGLVYDKRSIISTDEGIFIDNIFLEEPSKSSISLYIDSVVISGKKYSEKSFKLDYDNNDFTLYLTVVSFSRLFGDNYVIKYTIDEKDNEWLASKDTKLHIPYLPYGKSKLKFYAENDNNKTPIYELVITVAKPFWLTIPFVLLVISVISVLAYTAWVLRLQKINKRHKVIQELHNAKEKELLLENEVLLAKHQALRMQMNPHFIFNAINSIKGFYAENRKKEGMKYINSFSKLLREILESDQNYISIHREVYICRTYLELARIRFENQLYFSINLNNVNEEDILLIPPMLIQPFIENSLVHAFDGEQTSCEINIDITLKENLDIIITDNGVGIDYVNKNKKHTKSKSLTITRNRLRIIESETGQETKLSIVDRKKYNQSGTEVTLSIPIIKE